MKRKVLIAGNVTVGVVIICLSVFGLFASHNASDRGSAFLLLGFGASFCVVACGLWLRSRLVATVASVPLILVLGAICFVLLFAPLAWGDSNSRIAYLLQLAGVLLVGLQIAGLVDVFTRR